MAQRLKDYLQPPGAKRAGPARVYISRARDERRRISNESELVDMLADYGFVTIYPSDLSVAEQIAYMRNARCVIGAHGAGLTNMLFMNPGASVLEIRQPVGFWLLCCFFTLAGACRLRYYYELGQYADDLSGAPFETFHHADLAVDLESTEGTIRDMLSAE